MAIENKVNSYTQFSGVLASLNTNFKDNWNLFLDKYNNQNKIEPNHHQMKDMFKHIVSFLDTNDVYNSKNII